MGLNISNLDRTLTNEIQLLKQSILKHENSKPILDADSISFDELKRAQNSWQQFLLDNVSDCNITKFSITVDDLHKTLANAISSVFSIP